MKIIFSVIIPAYNVAGYIEGCLDSILAQTYQDYEILLIDDGSTDQTPEIADAYAKKDKRIQVIHKENEGVSAARNTGIEHARGTYFLFFDGDDFVEPYCMEELYQLVTEKKVDTILYGYYRYENKAVKETCYPIFQKERYEKDAIMKELVPRFIGLSYDSINDWLNHKEHALYVENPALWRAMVSKEIINKNHIRFDTSLKVGEDTIFISEYLSYAKSCYVQQKCYYYLVTRETSTIFQYEKNAVAKLEGKIKLLDARKRLTKSIERRHPVSFQNLWGGTVVMSCVEIAFLIAKKSKKLPFFRRYKLFLTYVQREDVRRMIQDFRLKKVGSVNSVPFLLLKGRQYFLLFLCTSILQLIHYEFKRT